MSSYPAQPEYDFVTSVLNGGITADIHTLLLGLLAVSVILLGLDLLLTAAGIDIPGYFSGLFDNGYSDYKKKRSRSEEFVLRYEVETGTYKGGMIQNMHYESEVVYEDKTHSIEDKSYIDAEYDD